MNDETTMTQIAADLGISELSQEEQNELIAQFGEIALKAATIAVLGNLSREKQEAFGKLAESGDAKALRDFLDAEVPNHEELAKAAVAEEVRRFKDFQKA